MFRVVEQSWRCVWPVCVVVAMLGSPAWAMTVIQLQPNEADSDDVFTYQYHGTNPGLNVAPFADLENLDTDSVGAPIGLFLGTSRSPTTMHMIDANGFLEGMPGYDPNTGVPVETGHDGHSWLKFDLSSVGVAAGRVGKATLNLWALDGFSITGSFYNPIATEPVETEVYAAAGPWDEQGLTWDNQDDGVSAPLPAFGSPVDSVVQTGVGQWVNFDVTSLVRDWLNNPASNRGFMLRQKEIVFSTQGAITPTGLVSSLYASSWFGDPNAPDGFNAPGDAVLRPFLQIEVVGGAGVPEPTTWATSLMAAGLLVGATRRRGQG